MGPQRADLLKKELSIFTFQDLLNHFPYRHVDKTRISAISEIGPDTDFIQVVGVVRNIDLAGQRSGRRLTAELFDKTGVLQLTWFQGVSWIHKNLQEGQSYLVYGKVGFYLGEPQIVHPEFEIFTPVSAGAKNVFEPVYPSTEKLKTRGLGGRQIGKLTQVLFTQIGEKDLPEILPGNILNRGSFISRFTAFKQIHFPSSQNEYEMAVRRLKFEELFISQLRMGLIRSRRHRHSKGVLFDKVGELFNTFYKEHLPFPLTNAQKRVIREIRTDTGRGTQMNRLLQGDVGSGKTIVALLIMLIAIDNGYQACLAAPTEILARQHFETITDLLKEMPVTVEILTGSTKKSARNKILPAVEDGTVQILIGTHSLFEETVQFKNLGIAIVDEQHRFGVEQRARLWKKAPLPPHILVMTATPIPRTLAMTAYGDLDYSIIDEMPPGRKPVKTVHRTEFDRPKVMDFIKVEIEKKRQAYIIFPLIEESDKLDYENLMKGYENVKAFFPEPKYYISMVHGRQPIIQKDTNMRRFVEGDTQIMVSTTVIEVGVNVPNASVMVIESAEKFGLSQLHQLRGRVGRSSEQSYCILLTGTKIGNDARERMKIMTSTNNGFEIADKDLALRGPGEIEGTKQSGVLNFKLASLVQDKATLEMAGKIVSEILDNDPELLSVENHSLKNYLVSQQGKTLWSRIS